MKKGILIIVLLIILVLIVSICIKSNIFSSSEKVDDYTELGKENAINYIKNKYGFVPNIVSVDNEYIENGTIPDVNFKGTLSGWVYVKMEHNNREFYTYIQGNKQTELGTDNYQYNEIVSDILSEVKDVVGKDPYRYNVEYGEVLYKDNKIICKGLIDKKYDKSNLIEISVENPINIKLEYVDNANIDKLQNKELSIFNKGNNVVFINYKSIDDCESSSVEYFTDTSIMSEATHISNAFIWDGFKGTYYNEFKD